MGKVEEAYTKWLRYSGYKKPKLDFDQYHRVVQSLKPAQVQELVKKIKARQQRQLASLRRMRRR